MRGKLLFLLGAGVGYVFGARAGRERYEAMKAQADTMWHDPRVQERLSDAQHAVKEKAPEVQAKLTEATGAAVGSIKDKVSSSSGDASGSGDAASTAAIAPAPPDAELVGGVDMAGDDATPSDVPRPPDVPKHQ